jgi:NarL family two-component system response regulator LiaR
VGTLEVDAVTGEPPPPLRVLLVDDDPLARSTVRGVLVDAGITVVGEAHDGREALQMARFHRPDIVVMDVMMPGLDGISALERMIADERIEAKVVMLSVRGEDDAGFLALRKGAMGYLNKDVDLDVLPTVLRDVAAGNAALSRRLTAELLRQLRAVPEAGIGMRPVQSVLTPREWEVADQLCLRRSVEEIADSLVLSSETVRTHIKNIMRKLDVHSRAALVEAVARLRSGVSSPDRGAGAED